MHRIEKISVRKTDKKFKGGIEERPENYPAPEGIHVHGSGFKERMLHGHSRHRGKVNWCVIPQHFLLKGFLKLVFSKSFQKIAYATFAMSWGAL